MEVRLSAATDTILAGVVGEEVTAVPAVRVTDPNGLPIAGVSISFRTTADGQLGVNSVTTGADGVASVQRWVLGPVSGTQVLTAQHGGDAGVQFVAVARPGPVAELRGIAGDQQAEWPGEVLPQPLTVRATDAYGNAIAGLDVSFTVTAGDGAIQGGTRVTDATGVARSGAWTLGNAVGLQQVTASSGSVQYVFSATAPEPPHLEGRLVFVSDRDGDSDIYTSAADGTGVRRLTASPGRDAEPAWSPDGTRIAFISERHGTPELYVMDADGGNVVRVAPDLAFAGAPDWSPDGSRVALSSLYNGSDGIATVRLSDGVILRLPDAAGYDAQPAWSPDARQLAFISDRDAYDFVFNIYTMNADGTDQRRRTQGFESWPNLVHYLHPSWSPDGTMIAFVYGRIINSTDVRFTVGVLSVATGERRDLAWAGDISWYALLDPGSLAWSPDGRGIAYSFVDCDLLTGTRCTGARSVKYIALDASTGGTLVSNASGPSWQR